MITSKAKSWQITRKFVIAVEFKETWSRSHISLCEMLERMLYSFRLRRKVQKESSSNELGLQHISAEINSSSKC
jgi:hypothetical protein